MLFLRPNTSKAKTGGFEFEISVGYTAKSYERKRGGGENRSRKGRGDTGRHTGMQGMKGREE